MDINMNETDTWAGIADMAARLLGTLMDEVRSSGDPATIAEASRLHGKRLAYPRLSVTMPHLGGAVRLELVLCDPHTNEPLVSMFSGVALTSREP